MRLTDLPESFRAALAVREAMRRLGFSASELFVVTDKDGVYITIVQGDKRYGLQAGLPVSRAQVESLWPHVVDAWNHGPEGEQRAIWDEWTSVWPDWRVELPKVLKKHGLRPGGEA